MRLSPDVETLMRKVVRKIKENPELDKYVEIIRAHRSTAEIFEDAAGNHAFDDYPEVWDITEHEGHVIRGFFQHYSCRRDDELKAQVEKLIEEA